MMKPSVPIAARKAAKKAGAKARQTKGN